MAKKIIKKTEKKAIVKKVEAEKKKTNPRVMVGEVISNKAAKTLRVRVEVKYPHPLYTKIIKEYKSFLVHSDEQVEIGTKIRFVETRPISKSKSWKLLEKLENKK